MKINSLKNIILLIFFTFLYNGWARLGFTSKQASEKYGVPTKSCKGDNFDREDTHNIENIIIMLCYIDDVVYMVVYRKEDDSCFSEFEMKVLMEKNDSGIWKDSIQTSNYQNDLITRYANSKIFGGRAYNFIYRSAKVFENSNGYCAFYDPYRKNLTVQSPRIPRSKKQLQMENDKVRKKLLDEENKKQAAQKALKAL